MTKDDPDDISDDIEKLSERKNYLALWLSRHRIEQDAAHQVQMMKDRTDWELDALENRPSEADEIPYQSFSDRLEQENQFLINYLPLPTIYHLGPVTTSSSVTTSGTADVFEYVSRIGDLNTPEALAFSEEYTSRYRKIQTCKIVQCRCENLSRSCDHPPAWEDFRRHSMAYLDYKIDPRKRTDAAMEMRTLLDGIQRRFVESGQEVGRRKI